MTSSAVNVLEIEPIRYCVSTVGDAPSTRPRAPCQASSPSRTTPATRDGSRAPLCASAARASNRRAVPGKTCIGAL
jgi:hypothetical protein